MTAARNSVAVSHIKKMDSPDLLYYMRFGAALVFVLCLMGGLAFILKKFDVCKIANVQTGRKRLKIMEVLPLDSRRRAVLIKRDDKEHLVILGLSGETVVETSIESPEKPEEK